MANYATLKAAIADVIKTNGSNAITGALLQSSLMAMVDSLGSGYQFMGVAVPSTNPGTPDAKVFYLCGPGTYPNFNALVVDDNKIGILYYDSSWHLSTLDGGASGSHIYATKALSVSSVQQDILRVAKNFGNALVVKIISNTATLGKFYLLYKLNGGSSWTYNDLTPRAAGEQQIFEVSGNITEILINTTNVTGAGSISIDVMYNEAATVEILKTSKQDKLISGTNIKTINGQSVLGSGNIDLETEKRFTEERGYFINGDYNINDFSINRLTELLNIPSNDCVFYHLWGDSSLGYYGILFVDANLNIVGHIDTGSGTNITYNWVVENISVPQTAKYIIIQSQRRDVTTNSTETLSTGIPFLETRKKQDLLISGTNIKTINGQSVLGSGNIDTSAGQDNQNVLYGKKWVACGDSFTQGDYNGIIQDSDFKFTDGLYSGKNKVYPFYIGRRNNMKIVNEAISGSIMALSKAYVDDPDNVPINNKYPFSYQRYLNVAQDADYITIWFGINDASLTYLGTIDDTTNESFYGAWNVVLEYFIKNRPFAKIGIVVTNGSTAEYRQAVRDVAAKWGIPYLDMTKDLQVPPIFDRDPSLGYSPIAQNLRSTRFRVTTLIKCVTANSDASFTKTKWQNMFWIAGTSYAVGDQVVYDNVPYKCTSANSDETFDYSKWRMGIWTAGTSYAVGDFVMYNGTYYKCITANSDSSFNSNKWSNMNWVAGTSYSVGDVAAYVNGHPNTIAHEYESIFIENWLRTL